MIRDRGSIKWTAMMLPEHVKQLREFNDEQSKKMKPELDEQQLQLIEETICEAMAEDLYLCFTSFKNDDFHLLIGKVHFVDIYKREFRIVDHYNKIHKFKQNDMIDVKST